MPELPEVETIVRDLQALLPGVSILEVSVERPDLIVGEGSDRFVAALRGRRIEGISRRAKNIVIALADELLVVNLGMTGRLLVAEATGQRPSHVGVRFALDDGRELLYHDVRRFGRLQRHAPAGWAARAATLGVEPLATDFTPERLLELAGRSRVAIKTWLMDQRHIVGVGNIYASEALFRAALDPRRPAKSLTRAQAGRLHRAIREVLLEAIDFRGTTLLDYRDVQGESGAFASRLSVYDRAGDPCTRCAAEIVRIVQGGRSTFFCAACQR
jgi:formamidopyrimidine-DNA glycosylase